jgi:hypothetical protein
MNYRNALAVAVGLLTLPLGLLWTVTLEAERAATGGSTWLPALGADPLVSVSIYRGLVALAGFLLSPVLVFAVGFVVGRRLDLGARYGEVLGALLVGSLVGYGLGRLAAVLVAFDAALPPAAVLAMVVPAVVVAVARAVVAGFAGAALGSLRSRRRARDARRDATDTVA